MTSFFIPNTTISRFLHFGSSSTLASNDALDEGLVRPESKPDDGEPERGEF
jgi:hypothetical protein